MLWAVHPRRLAPLAAPVIRVGVGLTLMTLAVHEKLANPGVTMAFLEEYHFNFMTMVGFDGFSDLHFTFAAGSVELMLGALIAFGIATRIAVATLTGFFIATLILLAPVELIGHFPLFGIAIVLILRGPGNLASSLALLDWRKRVPDEMAPVSEPTPHLVGARTLAQGRRTMGGR